MAMSCMASSSNHLSTKTTSTCTIETIKGKHLFHIAGYRATKCLGFNKFIRSGTFHVGGYDWAIRFYPNVKCCKDYISVEVELMSKNTEVKAFNDLRLVDQTAGLSRVVHRKAEAPGVAKNPDSPCLGLQMFKRSELETPAFVRDDCLTIECVIGVVKVPPQISETKTLSEIEVLPSDITDHLGKLLMEKESADVTLQVQGEAFSAHKIVLAMRSPVFKAQLYGPMREKKMQCITIDDMQPVVFKALLHFIYTDSLPAMMDGPDKNENKEMIQHLLVAADRYAMERLKMICEKTLCSSLDVETVATILVLADQHYCTKLKDACVEFIISSNKLKRNIW